MTDSSAGTGAGRSSDERIIQAALGLIAKDGLGAVTMSGVAETAGVARQTLYNHYPDVDSIVAAAVAAHNRESIKLLEAAMSVVDRPEDKLQQLVRHVVSIAAHAHHASGIEHGLSAGARATLGEYDEAIHACIRETLEEGRRVGTFRTDIEPEIDAGLIRHMLGGLAEQTGRAPEKSAELAAIGARTILAAVTGP